MGSLTWIAGSGDWSQAASWVVISSTDTVPGSADDVTIAAAGSYTITQDIAPTTTLDIPATVASLTLDAAGATLDASQSLDVTGTLAVTTGIIVLSGAHTQLGNEPVAALIAGLLSIGGGGNEFDALSASTLTIGEGFTVDATGISGETAILDSNDLVNDGTVIAEAAGGGSELVLIGFGSVTNNGTLIARNGDLLWITNEGSVASFDNAGLIVVGTGSTVELEISNGQGGAGRFLNTGTISIEAGGTLLVQLVPTLAALGAIRNSGGTVVLQGSIDGTGSTIDAGTAGTPGDPETLGNVALRGTLADATILGGRSFAIDNGELLGGTVIAGATPLTFDNAIVAGVTWRGELDVDGGGLSIGDAGGPFTIQTASGTRGTISLAGGGSITAGTLDNAVVTIDTPGTAADVLQAAAVGAHLVFRVSDGAAASVTSAQATSLASAATLLADGAGTQFVVNMPTGEVIIPPDPRFDPDPGFIPIPAGIFTNSGSIFVSNEATARLIASSGAGNSGLIEEQDAIIRIQDSGTSLDSAGTILANGGLIDIAGDVAGSGALFLQGGGTLVLHADASAGQAVVFLDNGSNLLSLGQAQGFQGQIWGFVAGDTIDLANIAFATAAKAFSETAEGIGRLTVSDGTTTAELPFGVPGIPGLSAASFDLAADAGGGTRVTAVDTPAAACFRQGTHIRTARGDVPVEALRVGELVVSALHGGLVPVRWIGWRRVDCRRHPRPRRVWPVRVRAGAIAEGRPGRDLLLSPDHDVFIPEQGVLIPVRLLVNGLTVVQEQVDHVTYFHVELPRHDVILAEGLPAESYLDTGNRGAFENGLGPVMLHADFAQHAWEAEACAPLVVTGPGLQAVRDAIWRRAGSRFPGRRTA